MAKRNRKSDGTEPSLSLDDQLCIALHSAARAISRAYGEVLREKGVTYPQYLVLLCLFEDDGLTVGELGRLLGLDSGTLTPVVKRLEADGLVLRQRSLVDERKVEVWLTKTGRAHKALAIRARQHVIDKLKMDNDEMAEMRGELMEIAERLLPDQGKNRVV